MPKSRFFTHRIRSKADHPLVALSERLSLCNSFSLRLFLVTIANEILGSWALLKKWPHQCTVEGGAAS